MVSQLRMITLLLILFMAIISTDARSEAPDEEMIWGLISKGKCLEALRKIKPPADINEFLSSPTGKCFYAKSICCSPVADISNNDIDEAVTNLIEAKKSFVNLTKSSSIWIDDARKQCEESRLSKSSNEIIPKDEQIDENIGSIKIVSRYHGKIMAGCESPNLSPVLLPTSDSQTRKFWRYLVINPGGSVVPPQDFLEMLKDTYVGARPQLEICPPFIALSDSQDPKKICNAAHRFVDYFDKHYNITRPPTWISIYHYTLENQPYLHATQTTGKINCKKVLGYYDWHRQSIIYRAPPEYFGTFRHELSHGLLFWDIPLAPRWFEEGLAALYENTDSSYKGIENNWRERVIEKTNIKKKDDNWKISPELLKSRVLSISTLEFEHSPLPATISREFLRNVQDCGDLPGLYKSMRRRYMQRENLKENKLEPHQNPTNEMVEDWYKLNKQFISTDCP